MRKILSLLMMLLFLGVTQMWGENLTKTEGFETKAAGTNYQSTVTVSEAESDCGIGWSIYYGTVSTNDKISGSQSAQMRYYNNKDDRGYVQSTTAVEGLSNVAFKARVSHLDMKLTVSYSEDGSAWTALAENIAFTAINAAGVQNLNYDIPSGGKYIKFEVGEGSTKPTSGNIKLIIDDVVFTYASSDPEPPVSQMKTIYCKMEHEWWTEANAAIAAYAWTEGGAANGDFPGVRMTAVENEDNMWKIDLDLALYEKVIFTRTSASGDVANWGAQTEDLVIPTNDNNLFTISTATGCWTDGCKVEGAWSVYGEGGGDTPEPPTPAEKDSIFFVNVSDWEAVRVHLWGGSAAGTEWPGVEMTKEAEQINGHDVYKFVADEGAYASCIFNNNDNDAQTADLTWNSGKYFYDGTWYAKESIPSADPGEGGGETTGDAIKLTFCYYNSTSGDGSSVKTLDAIFDEASRAYVDEVTTSSNVYAGRKYEDDISNDSVFSNLKFGTQSLAGELAFALANETEVDSIVIRAAMYSDSEGGEGFSVNGTAFTLSRGNKKFEDKVWKPTGKVSSIDIVQTKASKGRFYLTSITIYPKTQGGGDDPQPQMKTIYCKMEHEWWTDANAAIAAFAWTEGGAENAEFPGVRMTAVENEDNMWKIDLDLALYEKVIFTRVNPNDCDPGDMGCMYNWGAQTEDLTIPTDDKDLFTISTATGCWTGFECKVEGAWSVYGEGGGDTPEPKFYVTGNAALVGEEKQWTPGAIPSENDTLVLDLEAGKQYMLKVTLGNDWNHGVLGYDALSEKPEAIIRGVGDDDDNIIFSIAEDGQVKVVYIKGAGEEFTFKVIGNFYVAPTLKYYITGGEDIVGEGKATWGKTDALESYKDTLVLNLSEGAHKFKLITPAEQWLGLEALTDTAYGLYTDDDTNICFNLAEPGAVTVIFNATEFKVEGDFYIAPVAKYYLIGDSAFVVDAGATADKQWTPDAIASFKDTLVLNLKANQDYILRLSPFGTWADNRDYRHLTTPVTPGVNEIPEDEFGNHNIGFRLDEAGSVTFIYIPAANEQPEVFKILGNFHVDPVDMKDLEIVAEGVWAAEGGKLGVWAWNAIEDKGSWFATAVESEKLMAHIPVSYDKVIVARFAADAELDWNTALDQTADLDFDECAKLYLSENGAKFCEPAPAPQTEEVVFTVNVPEGTDSVFIAGTFNGWTFEKMNHVEGLQYTITKNIVKEGLEYKYTAGPDWAYVEYPKEAPNRTWAELDEVTAWEAVPQPVVPVDMKDLEIVAEGEWAAEGGKLGVWAWNAIEDEGHWFATAVENEKLMAHIPVAYDKVIVARFAADAELDWNNKLAQTSDLDFNECAKLYLATAGANWCAPVPAFEHHDFFITGNAALVGEELAWNPNAIPVDGTSKVLHLGAGDYEMKIVLDNCGASHCQQWLGCDRLSEEQVEGVACAGNGENIAFSLAEEGDVTINFVLTETDTIITLTGNFHVVQMVNIRLVPGVDWSLYNAKFAAVTWNVGQSMEFDGILTDWFVGSDTVIGQIPENADSIAFARFAPEVEIPFLNPNDDKFWNHSDKLAIDQSMIYTMLGFPVMLRDFCPGYWGEKPDFIADGFFLLGDFNNWTPSAAYQFGLVDEVGQRKVTAALEEGDELKVALYDRGYRIVWFPDNAGNYVVDEKHAGSAKDVYFREDYGGADDWHAHCIYVVENTPTAIDNTAVDAKAVKMLKNGMILIIKGDKTYNIMGQIVK